MNVVAAPPELRSGWLIGGGYQRSRSEPELS